jgi:hypothetical protein
MMRLLFVGLAICGVADVADASDLDSDHLRGSKVYEAPSYRPIRSAPSYAADVPAPSFPSAEPVPLPAVAVVARTFPQFRDFTFEIGVRYWYSSGKLAKDLYADPRVSSALVSRLTYSNLTAHTFEAFGRIDHSSGMFAKGNVGLAGLGSGTLNDEDFLPAFLGTYSNTASQQSGGRLDYASFDVGQIVARGARSSVGLFAGYGFLAERVNAYGCAQVGGNPFFCVPAISNAVLGITEDARFQFARLGILAEWSLLDCLKLSAEAAWLPYVTLNAEDTHWLRLGTTTNSISGPIPERGADMGIQIEALLSYQFTDAFSFGVGGRYWYLQTKGTTDFENVIVNFPGPTAQPVNFTTTRYGAFLQGAYKLGPM